MSRNLSKRLSVFLWHAPEDSAVVSQAYNKFKKITWIRAWLGDEGLIGGQERTRAVRNAVYNADVVILFLSTFSTTSAGYVQRDLRMVMDRDLDMPEGTIFVIPLRLNQCEMPYGLEKRAHIDYFPVNKRNSAYNKLLKSLSTVAEIKGIKPSRISSRPKRENSTVSQKTELKIPTSKEITKGGHTIYVLGKMEFVKIPAGAFVMGSNIMNPLGYPDERPQLNELIPYDYFIGRYPVTIAQYLTFVEWNQYEHEWVDDLSTKQNHPVTCITWNAAKDFCKWLNELYKKDLPKNLVFRLPLEVEWEKAARGEKGPVWPWGDEFDGKKCNTRENGMLGTTPVGKYSSKGGDSPYGAADMAGNVWEWTTTAFRKYPYYSNDGRESPKRGHICVVRGGSFNDVSKYARSAYRYMNPEPILYYFQGFRVILGPQLKLVTAKSSPHPVL